MKFEWDENKNKSNLEKHGIDFNDAKEIFDDEKRIISEDKRFDYGEKRWITIGKMYKALIVVVYTRLVRAFSSYLPQWGYELKARTSDTKKYNNDTK